MALVITLNGTKAGQKCFDFSVVGNANVDVITFKLTQPLDSVYSLAQLADLDAYIKLQSAGKDYIDKCIATSTYHPAVVQPQTSEYLEVSIMLKKKSTHYRNLNLQVQFEDDGGNVVSQSGIFGLNLSGNIPADEEISDEYPYAIQELEDIVLTYNGRISALETNTVKTSDVVDNLESTDAKKVLSANMGRELNEKINNGLAGIYKPQGSATVEELNALEVSYEMNGFVYDASDSGTLSHGSIHINEGDNVAIIFDENDETHQTWKWDTLSGIIDLSNYATKSFVGLPTMVAPILTQSTLNDADYNELTNGKGHQIIGTFLTYKNPVLMPCNISGTSIARSWFVAGNEFGIYAINPNDKTISLVSSILKIASLRSIWGINGKEIEYYLNNVFPYASNETTELKYETINNISISTDTTFTLANAPSNTYPEYKANITNSGANAITISMPANTVIRTNDDAITISSNTFTLPANATVELNYQNGTCIVFNWAVSN